MDRKDVAVATPVYGNPQLDQELEKFINEAHKLMSSFDNGDGKNYSRTLLKRLAKITKHLVAEADFYLTEKVEQTIGALKGQTIQNFTKLHERLSSNADLTDNK